MQPNFDAIEGCDWNRNYAKIRTKATSGHGGDFRSSSTPSLVLITHDKFSMPHSDGKKARFRRCDVPSSEHRPSF